MAKQTVVISVLAETRQARKALRDLGDQTGFTRLQSGLKKAGKAFLIAGGVVGTAAAVIAKKGVDAASSLEQSIGGVDAIFKENAKTVHKWAKSAAGDLGLSQNSYNELAAIIGTTLKNSGTPMDKLAGKTNKLIGVSADLAATFGGKVTDASNAMASALRGEFEPLRKYGVSLSQADIQARALADSGKNSAKELTKQEKALATQSLILEQSTDAAGAFSRESGTLAGQQERLKAKLENLAARIGGYLLPVMTKITAWVSDRLGPAFDGLTSWVQTKGAPLLKTLQGWFAANEGKIKAVAAQLTGALAKALTVAWVGLQNLAKGLEVAGQWIVKNRDWLAPLAVAVGTIVAA